MDPNAHGPRDASTHTHRETHTHRVAHTHTETHRDTHTHTHTNYSKSSANNSEAQLETGHYSEKCLELKGFVVMLLSGRAQQLL